MGWISDGAVFHSLEVLSIPIPERKVGGPSTSFEMTCFHILLNVTLTYKTKDLLQEEFWLYNEYADSLRGW
jgi:hypothetical protein